MEWVSTLIDVDLRGSRYIFILTGERQIANTLQSTLNEDFNEFGKTGGQPVRAVRATSGHHKDIYRELLEKRWQSEIDQRMRSEEEPFLVIIDSDFGPFDQQVDDWRIVWLGDAKNPKDNIPAMLDNFIRSIGRCEEVFAFLDRVTDPRTRLSKYGGVSSPQTPVAAKRRKKVGRPGIADPENGLSHTIDEIVADWSKTAGATQVAYGWKMRFVRQILKRNSNIREKYSEKSVYDGLMKSEQFEEIERRLTHPEIR